MTGAQPVTLPGHQWVPSTVRGASGDQPSPLVLGNMPVTRPTSQKEKPRRSRVRSHDWTEPEVGCEPGHWLLCVTFSENLSQPHRALPFISWSPHSLSIRGPWTLPSPGAESREAPQLLPQGRQDTETSLLDIYKLCLSPPPRLRCQQECHLNQPEQRPFSLLVSEN